MTALLPSPLSPHHIGMRLTWLGVVPGLLNVFTPCNASCILEQIVRSHETLMTHRLSDAQQEVRSSCGRSRGSFCRVLAKTLIPTYVGCQLFLFFFSPPLVQLRELVSISVTTATTATAKNNNLSNYSLLNCLFSKNKHFLSSIRILTEKWCQVADERLKTDRARSWNVQLLTSVSVKRKEKAFMYEKACVSAAAAAGKSRLQQSSGNRDHV